MSTGDRLDVTWPGERPYVGGSMLVVGGLISSYAPVVYVSELLLMGGRLTALLGLIYPLLIIVTGVLALLKPKLATAMGVVGIVVTVLSVFGSLGGIVIGPGLSFLGGVVCILWDVVTGMGDRPDALTGDVG